jgi:putative FmdB family regulatory protein
MPTYVYVCPKCDNLDNLAHSIHEDPEIYCGKCETQMSRKPQGYALSIKPFGFGGMG